MSIVHSRCVHALIAPPQPRESFSGMPILKLPFAMSSPQPRVQQLWPERAVSTIA